MSCLKSALYAAGSSLKPPSIQYPSSSSAEPATAANDLSKQASDAAAQISQQASGAAESISQQAQDALQSVSSAAGVSTAGARKALSEVSHPARPCWLPPFASICAGVRHPIHLSDLSVVFAMDTSALPAVAWFGLTNFSLSCPVNV